MATSFILFSGTNPSWLFCPPAINQQQGFQTAFLLKNFVIHIIFSLRHFRNSRPRFAKSTSTYRESGTPEAGIPVRANEEYWAHTSSDNTGEAQRIEHVDLDQCITPNKLNFSPTTYSFGPVGLIQFDL